MTHLTQARLVMTHLTRKAAHNTPPDACKVGHDTPLDARMVDHDT